MKLPRPLLTTYLIIIHLLLALILWKSNTIPALKSKFLNPSPTHLSDHYKNTLSYHKRIDPNVPPNSTIFIGDSLTQALCVTAITPQAINFGIGGDTTSNLLLRLPDYSSLQHAKLIVLAIGINDMPQQNNDTILQNLKAIRQQLPQNTPVLISGILPLDPSAKHHPFQITNQRITSLNQQLATLANTTPHTHFLPPSPQFTEQNGHLKPTLHDGDGLHLNSQGNQIWIQSLTQKIASLPTE